MITLVLQLAALLWLAMPSLSHAMSRDGAHGAAVPIRASLEVVQQGEWRDLFQTFSMGLQHDSEFRLRIHCARPLVIHCLAIDSQGNVVCLYPPRAYPTRGVVSTVHEPTSVIELHTVDLESAQRESGTRQFQGQYTILIVASEHDLDFKSLATPIAVMSQLHGNIRSPGFHLIQDGVVKKSAYIGLESNRVYGDLHGQLVVGLQRVHGMLLRHATHVITMSYAVLPAGESDPNRSELRRRLAKSMERSREFMVGGDLVAAIAESRVAVECADQFCSPEIYPFGHTYELIARCHLGVLLLRSNKYVEAESEFRKCTTIIDKLSQIQFGTQVWLFSQVVYGGLSEAVFGRGDRREGEIYYKKARSARDRILQANVGDASAIVASVVYAARCEMSRYMSVGRWEEACEELQHLRCVLLGVTSLKRKYSSRYTALALCDLALQIGNMHVDVGEYAAAGREYRDALAVLRLAGDSDELAVEKRLEVLLRLGDVHARVGRFGKAVNAYQSANDIVDGWRRINSRLGRGLIAQIVRRLRAASFGSDSNIQEYDDEEEGIPATVAVAGNGKMWLLEWARWASKSEPEKAIEVVNVVERDVLGTGRRRTAPAFVLVVKSILVRIEVARVQREESRVLQLVQTLVEESQSEEAQHPMCRTEVCSGLFAGAEALAEVGCYREALRVWRCASSFEADWETRLPAHKVRSAITTYISCSSRLKYQWEMSEEWMSEIVFKKERLRDTALSFGDGDIVSSAHAQAEVSWAMLAGMRYGNVPDSQLYEALASRKGSGVQAVQFRSSQLRHQQGMVTELRDLLDRLEFYELNTHRLLFRTRPAGLDVAGRIERPVREGKEKRSLERESWTELRRQLDDRQAFVDFYYVPEAITGTAQYHVFIVQKDRPLIHAELGDGAVINDAIERWQEAMDDPEAERQWARVLYERIWKPVSVALGPSIDTLFVSPDERLSELPWAALPIAPDDAVLLERYAVATVPYGDYLRQQLVERREKAERETGGPWLLVGDVDFNRAADDRQGDTRTLAGHRRWDPLPYTRWEIRRIGDLVEPQAVRQLAGAEATPENVLAGLTDAQYVHIATHGFFADDELRKALGYGESLELEDVRRKLEKVRLQLPFALSGLVLAGANRPVPMAADGTPLGDGGLLTASSIASLDLDHVELVVLSACETARGTLLVGEGAFALPRAFQVAGARNVVATYWEVDDQASAALMNLFYHYLIVENESPLQALRRAQLRLRDTPQPLAELATLRGPNLREGAKPLETTHSSAAAPTRRPTRLWAGYGLFGVGR